MMIRFKLLIEILFQTTYWDNFQTTYYDLHHLSLKYDTYAVLFAIWYVIWYATY